MKITEKSLEIDEKSMKIIETSTKINEKTNQQTCKFIQSLSVRRRRCASQIKPKTCKSIPIAIRTPQKVWFANQTNKHVNSFNRYPYATEGVLRRSNQKTCKFIPITIRTPQKACFADQTKKHVNLLQNEARATWKRLFGRQDEARITIKWRFRRQNQARTTIK